MYQDVYNHVETRMQELRRGSTQPQAQSASLADQLRQDAASALISLGNWIKPRAKAKAGRTSVSLRRAGLAG